MDQMLSWFGSGPPNPIESFLAVSSSAKWFISLDELLKYHLWHIMCNFFISTNRQNHYFYFTIFIYAKYSEGGTRLGSCSFSDRCRQSGFYYEKCVTSCKAQSDALNK